MAERLFRVREQIAKACEKAGRDKQSVKLLLASKTVEPDRIREAYGLGQNLFGENKAQELNHKYPFLQDLPIEWHFIGHLQSNKVKDVINSCNLIHSLDRLNLAKEINKQARKNNKVANVLIEVNTSGEDSKSGITHTKINEFCRQLQDFDNLVIKGFMTVAINSNNNEQVRDCFKKLTAASAEVKQLDLKNHQITELSMGMSGDYPVAIEEGATIIRLGSSIFGARR